MKVLFTSAALYLIPRVKKNTTTPIYSNAKAFRKGKRNAIILKTSKKEV